MSTAATLQVLSEQIHVLKVQNRLKDEAAGPLAENKNGRRKHTAGLNTKMAPLEERTHSSSSSTGSCGPRCRGFERTHSSSSTGSCGPRLRGFARQRKQRQPNLDHVDRLPTLSEFSSSEDGNVVSDNLLSPVYLSSRSVSRSGSQKGKSRGSGERLNKKVTTSNMLEEAQQLVALGNEQQALRLYRSSVQLARIELCAIQKQLNRVDSAHPSTLESIQSRLREDMLMANLTVASSRTSMGELYERLANYDNAISACKEAREACMRWIMLQEKQGPHVGLDKVTGLLSKADKIAFRSRLARDSDASRKRYHQRVAALRLKIASTRNPEERRKLYRKADQAVQCVRQLETETLGADHVQVVDTYQLASALALERNRTFQAIEHLQGALFICQQSLGMKHPRTGRVLLQMARIYAKQCEHRHPVDGSQNQREQQVTSELPPRKEEKSALDYYEAAVSVFRQSDGSCLRLLGAALKESAVIHYSRGELDAATPLLCEARQVYEILLVAKNGKEDAELCVEASRVWQQLAECYLKRKEFERASEALRTALSLQRQARSKSATKPDDEGVAKTLSRLGRAYAGMGEHDRALAMYQQALPIYRATVARSMEATKNGNKLGALAVHQDRLVHLFYSMAVLQEKTGHLEEAVAMFTNSLELRLASDALKESSGGCGANDASIDNYNRRCNITHCTMCLMGIGSVHFKRKEFEEAKQVYLDALAFCTADGAAEENPSLVHMINNRIREAQTNEAS